MIRSLLVPLDGSTFGEQALPLAVAIARRAGAMLQLVHVHQFMGPTTLEGVVINDDFEGQARQEEKAYLERQARRLAEVSQVQARPVLLEGDVIAGLQIWASSTNTDLVVMATHGRGALGRFWLGSTADAAIRHLTMPILLIRPEETPPDLVRNPAVCNMLLPLDGTRLSEQILEPALDLGKILDANFRLVRVVRPALRPDYLPEGSTMETYSPAMLEPVRLHQHQVEKDAQAYLDGVAGRIHERAPGVQTHVLIDEQAATGILSEASTWGADLIALETHARGGISRLLLGSVADKVIRGAHVPVLVHRPVSS